MRLEDLLGNKQPERGITISGVYSCQRNECFEESEEAKYIEDSQKLEWVCPSGHKSKIDDFNM